VLAAALLPSVMFVSYAFAVTTDRHDSDEDDESDDEGGSVSVLTLLCLPPVAMVVMACVLAEAALTFVMPTFAEHATSTGLASSPAAIGAFFAANAITYTVAAPTVGYLTSKHNARVMIISGLWLIALPSYFLGPSPWVGWLLRSVPVHVVVLLAFALLGLGEGLSMAPLMEDMMSSCSDRIEGDCIDSLSAILTGAYALGEVIGPLTGSTLTALFGFSWATTVLAITISGYAAFLSLVGLRVPLLRLIRRMSDSFSDFFGLERHAFELTPPLSPSPGSPSTGSPSTGSPTKPPERAASTPLGLCSSGLSSQAVVSSRVQGSRAKRVSHEVSTEPTSRQPTPRSSPSRSSRAARVSNESAGSSSSRPPSQRSSRLTRRRSSALYGRLAAAHVASIAELEAKLEAELDNRMDDAAALDDDDVHDKIADRLADSPPSGRLPGRAAPPGTAPPTAML